MAYEGWFRFGGNEVVNNERARGIASTVECPMFWLKGPRCTTLQDALGDAEYNAANLPDAPWFDPSMPDVSSRFFGVFALSVTGLNDSTRGASVVEGIDDGATIGRTRKSARQVRVRAMLLARGRDALDYGVSWLNAALDPDACGQHGTGCGTTDLEYLTDCPPARGEVPDFTPWVQSRRNEIVNPAPAVATGWAGIGATLDFSSGHLVATSTYAGTGSTTPRAQVVTAAGATPVTPGDPYYLRMEVKHSRGLPMEIRPWFMLADGTYVVYHVSPTASAPSDWTPVETAGTVPATAVLMGYQVIVKSDLDAAVVGDVFEVRNITTDEGDYFDGSTESTELARYSWAGAENASGSIEEVRSPTVRPRTDEEYAALVEPYRRFLHNVSVTSGPLERELMNKGEFWGQIFEWTYTAGRPWVYSATRAVDLPITPTVVIQDTPFNLVPYPSAELAGGDVDAAYNFSANPSVETNATGWATAVGAPITAGMVTSGRVTGELAAVGTSSFRAVATLSGSGTDGFFGIQQVVDLSARPAGSRVSINFWAAELLMSGTPTRQPIEFYAYWTATSGGAILRTDLLGSVSVDGGAVSAKSLVPPAGANFVTVRAQARLSWTAAAVVRLYADALAVTVP